MNNNNVKVTYNVNGVVEFPFSTFLGYEAEIEYNHTTKKHKVKDFQFMKPENEIIKPILEKECELHNILTSPSRFTEPCNINYYYELFGEKTFRLMAKDMIDEDSDFEEAFKECLPEMMKVLEKIHNPFRFGMCSICSKNNDDECEYCAGLSYDMEYGDMLYEFWCDKIEVKGIENIQEWIRNLPVAKKIASFMDTLLEYEGKPLGYEYCMGILLEIMDYTFIESLETCNTLYDVIRTLEDKWGVDGWIIMMDETLYDKVKARCK